MPSVLSFATHLPFIGSGNTKGGSIIVPLTSGLTCLDYSVLQIKAKIVSSHTADSKPVKQEVNRTVLQSLVLPALDVLWSISSKLAYFLYCRQEMVLLPFKLHLTFNLCMML